MHIELKPNKIPYKVLTAQTLNHWEAQANEIIMELLNKEVVARVEWPTLWTASGFWVPMSDGKGICFVIDLSKLNKFISCLVSTVDIMSSIDKSTCYFAKLDHHPQFLSKRP